MYAVNRIINFLESPVRCLILEIPAGDDLQQVLDLAYEQGKLIPRPDAVFIRVAAAMPIAKEELDAAINHPTVWPKTSIPFFVEGDRKEETFRRVRQTPVYFLFSFSFKLEISINANPLSAPGDTLHPDQESLLEQLKAAELSALVEGAEAILPEISGYYYMAPSGDPINIFLRAGNTQRSRSDLDAIFFWLLPHLRDCGAIVTDTWSIGSIALHISRSLCSYRRDSDVCPVEILDGHVRHDKDRSDRAERQIRRLYKVSVAGGGDAASRKIICLISVMNSGSFCRQLTALLHRRRTMGEAPLIESTRFIALFRVGSGEADIPTLFDCRTIAHVNHPAAEAIQADRLITIDPKTFFPAYALDFPLCIEDYRDPDSAPVWKSAADFFRKYDGTDLVRLHRDDDTKGRKIHHSIWIDTAALFQHPKFVRQLQLALAGATQKPSAIITPNHEAGRALSLLVRAHYGANNNEMPIFFHSTMKLRESSPNDKEIIEYLQGIESDSSIMIVDDAVVTGARAEDFLGNMRRHSFYKGRVQWLFGLARMSSVANICEQKWRLEKGRRRSARAPDLVYFVETLILPGSDLPCPWCEEQKKIASFNQGTQKIASWMTKVGETARHAHLSLNLSTGLKSDIFCVAGENSRLTFGPDSVFGDLVRDDATIFAAVASAIQKMRAPTAPIRGLGTGRMPLSIVLNWRDLFIKKWSDSLLRAALLRVCLPQDLIYSQRLEEDARTQAVMRLIFSDDSAHHDLAAELLLAAHLGKMPEIDLLDTALVDRMNGLG